MATSLIARGTEAPDFTAQTTDGDTVTLSSFRGKKRVVLMFYPKDDTPGCTKQMCTARDEGASYASADAVRFGVNDGSLASHTRFRDKYALDFPLLVDEDGAIARSLGSLRITGGIARSTIVVGRDGLVAFAEPGAHGFEAIAGALGA